MKIKSLLSILLLIICSMLFCSCDKTDKQFNEDITIEKEGYETCSTTDYTNFVNQNEINTTLSSYRLKSILEITSDDTVVTRTSVSAIIMLDSENEISELCAKITSLNSTNTFYIKDNVAYHYYSSRTENTKSKYNLNATSLLTIGLGNSIKYDAKELMNLFSELYLKQNIVISKQIKKSKTMFKIEGENNSFLIDTGGTDTNFNEVEGYLIFNNFDFYAAEFELENSIMQYNKKIESDYKVSIIKDDSSINFPNFSDYNQK